MLGDLLEPLPLDAEPPVVVEAPDLAGELPEVLGSSPDVDVVPARVGSFLVGKQACDCFERLSARRALRRSGPGRGPARRSGSGKRKSSPASCGSGAITPDGSRDQLKPGLGGRAGRRVESGLSGRRACQGRPA